MNMVGMNLIGLGLGSIYSTPLNSICNTHINIGMKLKTCLRYLNLFYEN